MKLYLSVLLIILLLSACATTKSTIDRQEIQNSSATNINEQSEEVLAMVNGEAITVNDYNEKLNRMSIYERARYRGEAGHRNFLKLMIQRRLMIQRAKKLDLDKSAEVQRKIDELVKDVIDTVLIEALIKQEIIDKTVVTDKEVKEYYDEHKAEFQEKEKIKLSHILVATENEAQGIHRELENGTDFAELANKKSMDQHTSKKGGDLGYLESGQIPAEFFKACSSLQIGDISDIVKTNLGYHIIKLEDKKPEGIKEFYEVSDEIKGKLISDKQQKEHQKWLRQLEENANIEIKEAFGGSNPN